MARPQRKSPVAWEKPLNAIGVPVLFCRRAGAYQHDTTVGQRLSRAQSAAGSRPAAPGFHGIAKAVKRALGVSRGSAARSQARYFFFVLPV
jgi:hypothetical protein